MFLFAAAGAGAGRAPLLARRHAGDQRRAAERASGAEATDAVLRLKYLDGGHGEGCNNEDDAFTLRRRRFHHFTFYGFLLCFAATSVATLYHYVFGWVAPYDLPSLPKLLGVVGGMSLMVGTAGLWRLNLQRHPQHGDAAQKPMDLGFIALLFLTSASGLALWLGRGTPALAAAAVPAPRGRDGAVRHAALRQVRARHLPQRGAAAPCDRKAPAQPDRPGAD